MASAYLSVLVSYLLVLCVRENRVVSDTASFSPMRMPLRPTARSSRPSKVARLVLHSMATGQCRTTTHQRVRILHFVSSIDRRLPTEVPGSNVNDSHDAGRQPERDLPRLYPPCTDVEAAQHALDVAIGAFFMYSDIRTALRGLLTCTLTGWYAVSISTFVCPCPIGLSSLAPRLSALPSLHVSTSMFIVCALSATVGFAAPFTFGTGAAAIVAAGLSPSTCSLNHCNTVRIRSA